MGGHGVLFGEYFLNAFLTVLPMGCKAGLSECRDDGSCGLAYCVHWLLVWQRV